MLSFYPGPSQIYPQVAQYMQDACTTGILSQNHRSDKFMVVCAETIACLKQKLNIPPNYEVVFTSSATECWEIIAQLFANFEGNSLHVYNGAFGEKWQVQNNEIYQGMRSSRNAFSLEFFFETVLDISALIKRKVSKNFNLLCLTPNETSNGTQLSAKTIENLRINFPESYLALDVTSAIGGTEQVWENGDFWFGSVQKCLGIPAGLGILVCSPRACRLAKEQGANNRHYNSLANLLKNIEVYQTPCTPNVLAIYLLGRVMQGVENISLIAERLKERHTKLVDFFNQLSLVKLFGNPEVYSTTVLCLQIEERYLKKLMQAFADKGILLGNGYGKWKNNTFRIANFPALSNQNFDLLQDTFVEIGVRIA